MKDYLLEDTIAAISTAPGKGAIAIIRLSGRDVFKIVKSMFQSEKKFEDIEPRKAVFGHIYNGKSEIDEVVVIKYKKPFSYTKENMVEINCHGGLYVSQKILSLVLKKGARLAQPGEFTFRAFMNGRFDLSQAEAVSDVIQAKTDFSLASSMKQLKGKLSQKIAEVKQTLLDANSLLELELDFSEEDVEFVNRGELVKKINQIQNELNELIKSFKIGRIAREGVKLVIAGKPNVGKSSLLNLLSKEDRAIVTEIPGTTRDAIEVQLDLEGILFRVVDTAGIKDSSDPIEKEGIRRSKKHMESADIIIHLFDGSTPLDSDDKAIIKTIEQVGHINLIRVINKSDLKTKMTKKELLGNNVPVLTVSALKGYGIELFEKTLVKEIFGKEKKLVRETVVSNTRHWFLLKEAAKNLANAEKDIKKNVSPEFISVYLRGALENLGEIVGTVTSEDILNNIFKNFCIGK